MIDQPLHSPLGIPRLIEHLRRSNQLRLHYAEQQADLAAEFLRVHSPSAEVRQHGNPILVASKAQVKLVTVSMVGRYGLKLEFDDGHDTGIFTWLYLAELSKNQDSMWVAYCEKLHQANKSREPDRQVVQIQPAQ